MPGPGQQSNAETARQVGEVVRWVLVDSVDLGAGRCVVSAGEMVSGPVPWFSAGTVGWRSWRAPRPGEQALLFCPDGELEGGVVLAGVYSDAQPAPRTDDVFYADTPDGSTFVYDPAAKRFTATFAAGVKALLKAPAGLELEGPVKITGAVDIAGAVKIGGDVDLQGKMDATGDVKAGPVSLKGHKHLGVTTGGGTSLGPVGGTP